MPGDSDSGEESIGTAFSPERVRSGSGPVSRVVIAAHYYFTAIIPEGAPQSWPWFTCGKTSMAWYNGTPDGSLSLVLVENSDCFRWERAMASTSTIQDGIYNPDLEGHPLQMVSEADALRDEPYSPQIYPGYDQIPWGSVSGLFTSLVYGLLHLYGWNAQFATDFERAWWHLATVAILIIGVGGPVLNYIVLAHAQRNKGDKHSAKDKWLAFSEFLDVCGVVFYCICALSLVIDSFRQLAYLPNNAFELPSLSIYWPHFS